MEVPRDLPPIPPSDSPDWRPIVVPPPPPQVTETSFRLPETNFAQLLEPQISEQDAREPFVRHFLEGWRPALAGISFADAAAPLNHELPMRQLEDFKLVPIVGGPRQPQPESHRAAANFAVILPDGIRGQYSDYFDGNPYLDAGQAIGLAFNGTLIAVASAIVPEGTSDVKIVQIHDVTSVRRPEKPPKELSKDSEEYRIYRERLKAYMTTGLHNNVDWATTLAHAWELTASELGANDAIIQSNQNNLWFSVQGHDRIYNKTAEKNGYQQDQDGNWRKPLHT